MIAYSINLPSNVQAQINSFAVRYSVDALVASAVAQVSSGGQQFFPNGSLMVSSFGVGVMGIGKDVAAALNLDATKQVGNIQAGVATLAVLLSVFAGNYPFALAAYATSIATVQQFNGIPPLSQVNNFVYNVSKIAANAGSYSVSSLIALRNSTTLDPTKAATTTSQLSTPAPDGQLIDPRARGLNNITDQSLVDPILQVYDPTLTNTAWYDDKGLVTGNPHIRASVQPITFMVYLDRNDPTQFLQNPQTNQPIELQLNTSLSSFEITSKHVYNRTPSRTGMHITLWGMEPDLISGSGTTGVFMNQYGLTDFMSVAGINDDITALLAQAHLSVSKLKLNNPNEAFRVAAQDAFVEFLKLFQMNGNIWYHDERYANGTNLGTIGQTEQQSPTAWSSKVGASSFQQHSRNNDVMTRGYVAMRYRNNIYLGYFKNLSWTQSADTPYMWLFNFTFQVERTYTALYYSNVQAQIQQNLTQLQTTFGNSQPPPPPTGQ